MSKNFVFSNTPTIKMPRTRFNLGHSVKTMFNVGDLIPILVQEVLPGDTFIEDTYHVVRSAVPFIRPVMDNLYMDIRYFFVPNRLTYDKWKNVMGENTVSYWANTQDYAVPTIHIDKVEPYSVAAALGLPVGTYKADVNVLPFRALALIWNEFYRDENVQRPVFVNLGDINSNSVDYTLTQNDFPTSYVGKLPKVAKLHDYFTSALPSPQKGNAIEVPISGISPILTNQLPFDEDDLNVHPIGFNSASGGLADAPSQGNYIPLGLQKQTGGGGTPINTILGSVDAFQDNVPLYQQLVPNNLYADYSFAELNVNDLRYAFALQKILERDARNGTRYREMLASYFGTTSLDQTQQVPEYLNGMRTPLNIEQVTQVAPTDDAPLGNVGAQSVSNGKCKFTKSFTEHGFVIGLASIRYKHTYQQGIEKFWTRKNRFDYYVPTMANIGEQPILIQELFVSNNTVQNESVFGYQEAWADYRYRPNRVNGYLSSQAETGFDIWHFADEYANAPVLSSSFIEETATFVERTLATVADTPEFLIDVYHDLKAVRVMPPYSIPGLIDHH